MTAKQLKINSGLQFICFDYIKYTNSLTNEKEHQLSIGLLITLDLFLCFSM